MPKAEPQRLTTSGRALRVFVAACVLQAAIYAALALLL
jgi:hypothetical protein